MKTVKLITLSMLILIICATESTAQRRVVVRRGPGPRHTTLVVRRGHPIRRVLPAAVVVRAARHPVFVGAPLAFLPALVWTPTIVALPVRENLVWQDSEVIEKDEGWVDTNFGIDGNGTALFLEIAGKAELNFAEITFANGNVQVVDFNEHTRDSGIYRFLDLGNTRHVMTARILAKSKSKDTKLTVFLGK